MRLRHVLAVLAAVVTAVIVGAVGVVHHRSLLDIVCMASVLACGAAFVVGRQDGAS